MIPTCGQRCLTCKHATGSLREGAGANPERRSAGDPVRPASRRGHVGLRP